MTANIDLVSFFLFAPFGAARQCGLDSLKFEMASGSAYGGNYRLLIGAHYTVWQIKVNGELTGTPLRSNCLSAIHH
jgi:hypothetical protein